jgi:3-polyprenyl-4-hydroxybenzoate decarboxylase
MINEASRANPLRRCDDARIFETEERLVSFNREGEGYAFHGESAELARAVLDALTRPRSLDELLSHLGELSGGPIQHPEVVDELVVKLLEAGALEWCSANTRRADPDPGHRPMRLVLGLSGAVAAMAAPELVQRLQRAGFVVRILATANALRFVSAEALEALIHRRVIRSMWPEDGDDLRVPHIDLSTWADVVLICPASATTLSRLATGNHDCVVAATALATRAPVMVVPSMNPAMYDSRSVQRNLATLRTDGMYVVHPGRGIELADSPGERAPLLGAAPSPAIIVDLVRRMLLDREQPPVGRPDRVEDWDAMYSAGLEDPPAWHNPEVDADIAQEVERLAPEPSAILDIGTGLGTLAIAFARQGHRVVATDLSAVALEEACKSAPDASVCWMQDDITDSKVRGAFNVALDRGCFHLLPDEKCRAYVDCVARLLPAGSALVIKSLAGDTAAQLGTRPCTDAEVDRWFGRRFEIERSADTEFASEDGPVPGRLVVLRRRG